MKAKIQSCLNTNGSIQNGLNGMEDYNFITRAYEIINEYLHQDINNHYDEETYSILFPKK